MAQGLPPVEQAVQMRRVFANKLGLSQDVLWEQMLQRRHEFRDEIIRTLGQSGSTSSNYDMNLRAYQWDVYEALSQTEFSLPKTPDDVSANDYRARVRMAYQIGELKQQPSQISTFEPVSDWYFLFSRISPDKTHQEINQMATVAHDAITLRGIRKKIALEHGFSEHSLWKKMCVEIRHRAEVLPVFAKLLLEKEDSFDRVEVRASQWDVREALQPQHCYYAVRYGLTPEEQEFDTFGISVRRVYESWAQYRKETEQLASFEEFIADFVKDGWPERKQNAIAN